MVQYPKHQHWRLLGLPRCSYIAVDGMVLRSIRVYPCGPVPQTSALEVVRVTSV